MPGSGSGGHAGREHQVEAVAEPERHALEHRPRQMAPIVADGQPDERAAGERVRVRAALPGQVRQEEQAVAAGRHARRPPSTSAPNPMPGASASRNQRRLPAAESMTDIMCHRPGHGVAEGVDAPSRLEERPIGRGEDDP